MGHIWGVKGGRCYFKAGSDTTLKTILWLTVWGGGLTVLRGSSAFCDGPIQHNMEMLLLLFLDLQIYALEIHSSSRSTGIPSCFLPVPPGDSWGPADALAHLSSPDTPGSLPEAAPAQRYPCSVRVHAIAPIWQADVVNLQRGGTQGFQGIRIAVQLLQSLLVVLGPGKTF